VTDGRDEGDDYQQEEDGVHDAIQQTIENLAVHNAIARPIIILCAVALVYLLGAAWLLVVTRRLNHLSLAVAARIVGLGVLAYVASKVLSAVVVDPRPYLVTHTHPLIATARDNGFPSDHVLLVAWLTASLWWIDRRWIAAFAAGVILVMIGRLGVGAHHTLDVLGSVTIVVVAALIARAIPLPAQWSAPLFPARRAVDRAGRQ
jgi:membrane-associated phospholipid phosphatase